MPIQHGICVRLERGLLSVLHLQTACSEREKRRKVRIWCLSSRGGDQNGSASMVARAAERYGARGGPAGTRRGSCLTMSRCIRLQRSRAVDPAPGRCGCTSGHGHLLRVRWVRPASEHAINRPASGSTFARVKAATLVPALDSSAHVKSRSRLPVHRASPASLDAVHLGLLELRLPLFIARGSRSPDPPPPSAPTSASRGLPRCLRGPPAPPRRLPF